MAENPKVPNLVWELHYSLELDRGKGETVVAAGSLDKILAENIDDAMAQIRKAWIGQEWHDPCPRPTRWPTKDEPEMLVLDQMLPVVGVQFLLVEIHASLTKPGPAKETREPIKCHGCNGQMTNGIFCHETLCPETWKGARACQECGEPFEPGEDDMDAICKNCR